jgi:hypothetical protein
MFSLFYLMIFSISVLQTGAARDISILKTDAENGNAKSQVQLGMAYISGIGVAVDEAEAAKWFRQAAEQGNVDGEYFIAELYLTGRGVPVSSNEAVKWMKRAAEAGDPRAQFNVAVMYSQGYTVNKNYNEAAKWMRKAADQGFAAGEFGLGSMYAHGNGVAQNAVEAVKWYRKAGAKGDPEALNNLAFLLATSTDKTLKDPEEAIVIALKAVAISDENPACFDTLATAYYEAGQFEKAADAEQRALRLKPDNLAYKKALEKYLSRKSSLQ